MTTISRRQSFALPAVALTAATSESASAKFARLMGELEKLVQSWPDREQTTPTLLTPEEVTSWITVLRYLVVNHGQRLKEIEDCTSCGETMPAAKGMT